MNQTIESIKKKTNKKQKEKDTEQKKGEMREHRQEQRQLRGQKSHNNNKAQWSLEREGFITSLVNTLNPSGTALSREREMKVWEKQKQIRQSGRESVVLAIQIFWGGGAKEEENDCRVLSL